jgi:hypothetical protein
VPADSAAAAATAAAAAAVAAAADPAAAKSTAVITSPEAFIRATGAATQVDARGRGLCVCPTVDWRCMQQLLLSPRHIAVHRCSWTRLGRQQQRAAAW